MYTFPGVVPGSYWLTVLFSDGGTYTSSVDLSYDEHLRLDVGHPADSPLWSGTLRGPHGRAVRGPGFVVLESTVVAGRKIRIPYDDDGRVSARVPDGAWRVHVVLPARFDTEIVTGDVLAFDGRDVYRDVVVPGGRIEGTVTGDLSASSSPQRVRCRRLGADASKSRDATVRSDGSFVIDGLRDGAYVLDGAGQPLGDSSGRPLQVTVPQDGIATATLLPVPPRDGKTAPVLQVDLR